MEKLPLESGIGGSSMACFILDDDYLERIKKRVRDHYFWTF